MQPQPLSTPVPTEGTHNAGDLKACASLRQTVGVYVDVHICDQRDSSGFCSRRASDVIHDTVYVALPHTQKVNYEEHKRITSCWSSSYPLMNCVSM